METRKGEMVKEFRAQVIKEREVWAAKEKVQREKWEAERVQAIRANAYQQMEPTLQTLIDKNKEEVRKAVEECEKRTEMIRG